jgi:LysR family transcriptional regulator, glycine cleavage system transcriptional activator
MSALRAFEAAARHMSFKKAAVELGVTPTAVSHQLRELEQFCGQSLFRRLPRPLALTEAGERLYPVLSNGFDAISAVLRVVKEGKRRPLRVTTTNAFAHRWLVPRLTQWRKAHPEVTLQVLGTDRALDLGAGEADVAIRYAFGPPAGLVSHELMRDTFWPMATPALLASEQPIRRAADLLQHTVIHAEWLVGDQHSPTWTRWLEVARRTDPTVPEVGETQGLYFVEELHALEAVVAGQGIGICSDVLAGRDLASGALKKAWDMPLPGYGFYLCYAKGHDRQALVDTFRHWITRAVLA